jgi:recombination protein RecA
MSLKDLKTKLQKIKGIRADILSQSEVAASKDWLKTPAYDLNRILSGSLYKGIPTKSFSLFIGPETSGKSSFMALCVAEAQKNGYKPIIIDTEGGWDKDFTARWGINADEAIHIYTPWIDKICMVLGNIINEEEEEKLIIVLDSIGGIERMKLLDDSIGGDVKADQGTLQKEIKRMLKMLLNICKSKNSIAMAAGHYYGNSSGYGEADQVGGGKFVKLAPDIIVSLKKQKLFENPNAQSLKAKGKIIGSTIKAITLKNRYYPPFQEATIEIDFNKGINEYAGLMGLLVDSELVKIGGSWYTFPNGEKAQGSTNAMEILKNDDKILNELDNWLKNTGYSTINEIFAEAMEVIEEEK